ncbi:MAG: YbaN family protein [Woeseiaceae bacterium]|nr:YbaN family protein [Woeseiaceae bacterium]
MKQLTRHAARLLWLLVGFLALALGAIGAFVPLLPTVPFILLAAFAFAESSERMHTWLLEHNLFGGMIKDWRRYGAISLRAKVASVVTMALVLIISALHGVAAWILITQAVILSGSAIYVLSRPLPPADRGT